MTTAHEDIAVAALAEVLVLVDDSEVWGILVHLAFPNAEDPAMLARYLRWCPVPKKRAWASTGVQIVLQRSERQFLALSGAVFAAAGPRAHPVWDALATPWAGAGEASASGD